MLIRDGYIGNKEKIKNIEIKNPSNFGNIIGILSDGKTLLIQKSGWNSSTLGISTDGGNTIIWGNQSFGSGGVYKLVGFIETNDNEILISTAEKSGSSPAIGQVWKSQGWDKTTANATSWKIVTETVGTGVQFNGRWGFNERCKIISNDNLNGTLVIAEYGTPVSTALSNFSDGNKAAIRVKISYDNGETWKDIFNLYEHYNRKNAQFHVHGVAVDNLFKRILISYGDGNDGHGGECGVIYCNFEDLSNPIWRDIPSTVSRNPLWKQVTTIIPTEDFIAFISDSKIGSIRVVPRISYRHYGEITDIVNLPDAIIGSNAFKYKNKYIFTYQVESQKDHKPCIYEYENGTFTEIYKHAELRTTGMGIFNCVIDNKGNVYANISLDGNNRLLKGMYTE